MPIFRVKMGMLNCTDDILYGGQSADFFDCGDGLNIIVDFNPENDDG